jgi:DNA repair exonuclease SbcCD nuclease subunit
LAPAAGGIFPEDEANRLFNKDDRLAIIFGIPEPRKKYLLAETSAGKDETEEAIREAMHRLCFMLVAKRKEYRSMPCIVLYHGEVAGTVYQNDQTIERGTGISITIDDLNDISADYYALGHIHKPQKVGNLPAYYAGSMYPKDFGETHKAGFNVVELTQAGEVAKYGCHADIERIGIPHPQNSHVIINWNDTSDGTPEQYAQFRKEVIGKRVWFEIMCTQKDRLSTNADE